MRFDGYVDLIGRQRLEVFFEKIVGGRRDEKTAAQIGITILDTRAGGRFVAEN